MSNIKFDSINDYRDIETVNMYQKIKNEGGDLQYFLNGQKISARDNGRTPFQWDSTTNAGFTTGTPWLKVNPNYKTVNVAAEEKNPTSTLNYFKKMIRLRKALPELVYGAYALVDKDNKKVYAYTRTLNHNKVLVILNFSKDDVMFNVPSSAGKIKTVLINNLNTVTINRNQVKLQPYQAVIVRVN